MKKGLLIITFVAIILLGGLHQIANIFYLYWDVPWFDVLMHLLGGFSIAALFVWVWYRGRQIPSRRSALIATILFVLAVGIAWEIFEYAFDIANPAGQSYVADTGYDLVFDVLGALLGGLIATAKRLHV